MTWLPEGLFGASRAVAECSQYPARLDRESTSCHRLFGASKQDRKFVNVSYESSEPDRCATQGSFGTTGRR